MLVLQAHDDGLPIEKDDSSDGGPRDEDDPLYDVPSSPSVPNIDSPEELAEDESSIETWEDIACE